MANTYEQFLKTVRPEMLDANGVFRSPDAGVNYQAEGMTPEQFYAFMNQQVGDQMARDGADSGQRARGNADATWQEGVISTKNGPLGNWGVPLAMLAAPYVLSSMGVGAAGASGGTAGGGAVGASVAPNAGMTLAEQYASYGAGGGGVTGGLSTGTVGGFTGAAGGDLLGTVGSAGSSAFSAPSLMEDAAGNIMNTSGTSAFSAPGGISGGMSSQGGIMETAGQWLKDNPTLAKLAGAGLGALSAKDTQTTQSTSKDPWAPAQPYLLDNLKTNAAMQEYYRQNPFSNEQKAAYQGLLDTAANNKAVGAGLLANSNAFMQSRRGVMPAMQALPTGGSAPAIDWTQYQNIGRR